MMINDRQTEPATPAAESRNRLATTAEHEQKDNTMKIYTFPVAPNPTKVSLYLAEKEAAGCRLELESIAVNLVKGEQRTAEHRARNPLARLPVLELDDGSYLLESLPIIEYLEELYPDPPMIGSDPVERARVRSLERIADQGVLLAVGVVIHATNSPTGMKPVPAVAAAFSQRLPAPLAFLNEQLADGRRFLAGDRPTIVDCTLAAAFQFARWGKVDLVGEYEHLARWDSAYRQRQAVNKVFVM